MNKPHRTLQAQAEENKSIFGREGAMLSFIIMHSRQALHFPAEWIEEGRMGVEKCSSPV